MEPSSLGEERKWKKIDHGHKKVKLPKRVMGVDHQD